MSAGLPRRPSDVPHDVALAELISQYDEHIRNVILARSRIADPAKAEAVFEYAIAALAVAHAVVDRLLEARWSTVRDALAADAGRGPEVAVACGLDPVEGRGRIEQLGGLAKPPGLMSDKEHRIVLLLARGLGGRYENPGT